MAKSKREVLPEGWRVIVWEYFDDPSYGNGGGSYVFYVSLQRWVDPRVTRFRHKFIEGYWKTLSSVNLGRNAPTDGDFAYWTDHFTGTALQFEAAKAEHRNITW